MTVEQKEQAIIGLLAEIPLFRRIRIAIAIMKGVEREQATEPTNENIKIDESAVQQLKADIAAYESGDLEGVDGWQSLANLRSDLLPKS
ncbi:MAG: hypothetical protein AAFQ87_14055 [Bacteroidota bacterium]